MSAPRRSGGAVRLVGGLVGLGLLLALVLAGWAAFSWYGPGPRTEDGGDRVVVLRSGESVASMAESLEAAGVVGSAEQFRLAAKLTRADRKMRAGEYAFPSRASLAQIIDVIRSGKVVRHFVTLPEGRSVKQALEVLAKHEMLTGTVTAVPSEGSLAPDTYEVQRGETRQSVIDRMRAAQAKILADEWAKRAANLPVRNPQEALVLASIVEKETGLAKERPQVAAVFVNRMRQGMRLESDPTIIYGVTKGLPLGRGIRRSELDAITPWNTYQIDGLPPTPIANPGRAAIRAVLNPPPSPYLFFVADGTGGHVFAATYEQHLINVARWRRLEAERASAVPPATQAGVVSPIGTPAGAAGAAASVAAAVNAGAPVAPAAAPQAKSPAPAGAR